MLTVVLFAYLLHIATGRAHFKQEEYEEFVQNTIDVRVGADPGIVSTFVLNPQLKTAVPHYHQSQSKYHVNGTDYVYIHNGVAKIAIEITDGAPHLGSDTLCKISRVWGVCNNVLYFDKIPRKCKTDDKITMICDIETCPVWFNRTQNTVADCDVGIRMGGATIDVDCTRYIHIGAKKRMIPAYLETSEYPERLSLWQGKSNYEYYCTEKRFELYNISDDPKQNFMDYVTLVMIIGALLFLLTLHDLLDTNTDALWRKIARHHYLLISFITWICTNKVYGYLVLKKHVFMPESIDITYGENFSVWYCVQYITITLVVLCYTCAILLVIGVEGGRTKFSIPVFYTAFYRIYTKSLNNKQVMIYSIFWSLDFLLATSAHVNFPPTIKTESVSLIGFVLGVTLGFFSGLRFRSIVSANYNPIVFASCCIFLCICIIHTTIFMVHPIFSDSDNMSETTSSTFSLLVVLLSVTAGMGTYQSYETRLHTPSRESDCL
jgi:hypothetical protein